jgi:hypothetical protein
VPTIQPGHVSLKFAVPADMPQGLYAVKLDSSRPLYILNRPQAYWAQGEGGQRAWPGGWLRILGRNLVCSGGTPLVYVAGGTATTLTASGDGFSLETDVPASLPAGLYHVYVHNGCGGPTGWSDPTDIEIASQPADPAPIISASDMGAFGDGIHDDTTAIETLLQTLAEQNGGIAYFPPGTYQVQRRIDLPPNVLLRGGGREATFIRWNVDPAVRLDAAIRGSHDFAIEDISLVFPVSRVRNGIVSGMPWRSGTVFDQSLEIEVLGDLAGNIRLSRLLLYWQVDVASICDNPPNDCQEDPAYGAEGFLLLLGGTNIRVEDNDLRSAETVANIVGGNDLLFAHNDCVIGERGWGFNLAGGQRVIVEGNRFLGTVDTRSGVTLWAPEPYRNAYVAHNDIEKITFSDCESFTTDGAQGRYFGAIASATADTVTLPSGTTWSRPLDPISSTTCYILGGRGQGQYRHIVSGTCGDGSTCTAQLDRPWDVVPDTTSQIGINHTAERLLIVSNTVLNGRYIQIYGSGYEITLADNDVIDSGGLSSFADRYPGGSQTDFDTQPQYFMQWLGNRISGGKTPKCPRYSAEKLGMQIISGNSGDAYWPWTMIRGFVVRGNIGTNEVGISASSEQPSDDALIQDLVLEDNVLSSNDMGIAILGRVAGAVTEGNTFEGIDTPMQISDCVEIEIHEGLTPSRPPKPEVVRCLGPTGTVQGPHPTYEWRDSCDVKLYYHLAIDKMASPDDPIGTGVGVFRYDCTREEAGCVSGGTCAVTPMLPAATELQPGIYEVWVVAPDAQGNIDLLAWDSVLSQKRFVVE